MTRLIDLSHTVEDGLVTYRGLPAPLVCDYLTREASQAHYAEGTTFQIGRIDMVANTGTYIDAPFHRFADGCDVAGLALESVAELDALRFRAPAGAHAIGPELFAGADVRGRAVLVETGWSRHWNTDRYFEGNPHLTAAAAVALRDGGAALIGIDSLNIDSTATNERPVHTTLLGAGVLVVEHLCNLDAIPDGPFRFSAVPVKVRGLGTFPVRAYAAVGR